MEDREFCLPLITLPGKSIACVLKSVLQGQGVGWDWKLEVFGPDSRVVSFGEVICS
jgi:hypothetical protein